MRFTNWFLGIAGVGAIAASGLVGCGGSSSGNTGGSGGSSTGTKSSPSTATSTGSTNPVSTGSSMGGPCAPTAACPAATAAKACIGLTDNTGKTKFGLRMSELDVTKPSVLSMGIIGEVVGGAVQLSEMSCNLTGSGLFTWLLQFDTTAGTLTTGGAKPVTDPTMGYSFDTDTLQGFSLAPVMLNVKPDSTGKFTSTMGQDLIVPIFLDTMGDVVLLPLKSATITMGTLSDGNNCIGTYNAASLDPGNSCQPVPPATTFTDGASLDGYITLADADNVQIAQLSESLCVLLSGNAGMYGDGASPVAHCKKDSSGNFLYKGDWCGGTMANSPGMAANSTCADSQQLTANFAASSVTIN